MIRVIRELLRAQSIDGRDPAAARDAARRILRGRRYRDVPVRRPFARQTRWVGHQLDRFFSWLGRLFDFAVPGSSAVAWVVLGAIAVVVVVWATRRIGFRRRRGGLEHDVVESIDADGLDREAAEAERQGDLRRAIELRFRAGIARLEQEAALPASKRTNASLRPILPAPFTELGATFDAVHYGDAAPAPGDVERARRSWPDVITGTRRAAAAGDGSGRRTRRLLRRRRGAAS